MGQKCGGETELSALQDEEGDQDGNADLLSMAPLESPLRRGFLVPANTNRIQRSGRRAGRAIAPLRSPYSAISP